MFQPRLFLMVVLFASPVFGNFEAQARPELTNCQKNFNKYLKAPSHKAFATTLGNDPGFHLGSCYAVTGYSVKNLAEKKAVSECNRVRRKIDGGKCKVIHSR